MNNEINLLTTVRDADSQNNYVTFGFVMKGLTPCVTIGVSSDTKAAVTIPVKDFTGVSAILDEVAYQSQKT